ncbi:fimbrial biogenesis chaperone [Morganella morganii]|uniref:fimbrial biogenesis chaperone n=1 Tax=Morganella morganii TaxID=582 RepID=UPI0020239B84|nr:molecular chaperone [Morganella morganii]
MCFSFRRTAGCTAAALMMAFWSVSSVAGVSLTATRLIVSGVSGTQEAGSSIGVRSDDSSVRPFLVKAQIFRDVDGQDTSVPFVLSPALFRLEPGSTNQLRVIKKGNTLPQNKESLFYLRVAALPASSSAQTEFSAPEGVLNVATGNIIKLFYRPYGLPVTQKEAMGQLRFTAAGNRLKVTNPTPYYITLSSLKVNGKPVSIRRQREQNMIAPYGETFFADAPLKGEVHWQVINDYGGREDFHGSVQ